MYPNSVSFFSLLVPPCKNSVTFHLSEWYMWYDARVFIPLNYSVALSAFCGGNDCNIRMRG